MTKDELLEVLKGCKRGAYRDAEQWHGAADDALIEYINDPEIKAAFDAVQKWYS